MKRSNVNVIIDNAINSQDYYRMYSSRDFYRGTSFKMAGAWTPDTHYFNDEHIIDFISCEGALLYCLRGHLSSEWNKPNLIYKDDIIVGVESNPYWAFIMGNSGKGQKGDKGDIGPIGPSGTDGITPQLKIEDGRWLLSMDKGQTWQDIGQATGDPGQNGTDGKNGSDGIGVISGGTTGQALVKKSDADYDTEWKTISEGGEIPNFDAEVANVSSTTEANANVVLEGDIFKFSFGLPKGADGKDGKDGEDGKDGTNGTDGSNGEDGKTSYLHIKYSNDGGVTFTGNNGEDPGAWIGIYVDYNINDSDDPSDYKWTKIKGEPGITGDPGPAGKDGVDGLPGIGIEVRYCLGTTTIYGGTSTPGTTRQPTGWNLAVPTPTEETPYIWFIQARVNYTNNSDKVGTIEGSWSTPTKLSGTNGLNGANGSKGQMIYPEGIYKVDTIYQGTVDKTPYVYDSNDANYYVLNIVGTWQGTLHSNESPSTDTSNSWVKLEAFEALYAKIGIIPNALIGSAVFNDAYMFSQQGIDENGEISTHYENFNSITPGKPASSTDPEKPGIRTFIPNIMFNFVTGEGHLAAGKVAFTKNGKVTADSLKLYGNSSYVYSSVNNTGDTGFINTLNAELNGWSTYTWARYQIGLQGDSNTYELNNYYNGTIINNLRTKEVIISPYLTSKFICPVEDSSAGDDSSENPTFAGVSVQEFKEIRLRPGGIVEYIFYPTNKTIGSDGVYNYSGDILIKNSASFIFNDTGSKYIVSKSAEKAAVSSGIVAKGYLTVNSDLSLKSYEITSIVPGINLTARVYGSGATKGFFIIEDSSNSAYSNALLGNCRMFSSNATTNDNNYNTSVITIGTRPHALFGNSFIICAKPIGTVYSEFEIPFYLMHMKPFSYYSS
jgi:hypothetical protein